MTTSTHNFFEHPDEPSEGGVAAEGLDLRRSRNALYTLTGGAGNDTMIGEAGADTIHFFDPSGETLDFTAVGAIDSFADFTTFERESGNLGYASTTLFHVDGSTTSSIMLIGVQVASLSDADFLFSP